MANLFLFVFLFFAFFYDNVIAIRCRYSPTVWNCFTKWLSNCSTAMLKQSYHVLVMTLSRLSMRYPQTRQDTCKAIYQRFVSTAKFAPGIPLPQSRAHI